MIQRKKILLTARVNFFTSYSAYTKNKEVKQVKGKAEAEG
jgi:hypothetical protein